MVQPDNPKLVYVPLDELQTPKSGTECIVNNWWMVHPERGAIFYQANPRWPWKAPQCNADERCCKTLTKKLYPWAECRQIPVAFVDRSE